MPSSTILMNWVGYNLEPHTQIITCEVTQLGTKLRFIMKHDNALSSISIKGFSLIEILVSLLLGSALLILSFNLYFSTKQSEALSTTILNTQTEARNGLHFIRQGVEHAGFTTNVMNIQKEVIFPLNNRFAAGQVIHLRATDPFNQALTVRLQGDEQIPLRACNGAVIPNANTSTFELWYEFFVDDNILYCQLYNDGTQSGDAVPLANSIAGLKIRAFTQNPLTGLTAIRVDTDFNLTGIFDEIKGVQVQLISRSDQPIRPENALTAITITGFDDVEFNDRFFYINTNRYFVAQNQ